MIIFVSGRKGTGKTTVANYLGKRFNVTPVAFADKLKDMLYELCMLFDIPITSRDDLDNPITKEKYRRLMQLFGTEVCQKYFGRTCWASLIDASKAPVTIISDLRFKHELRYFQRQGHECVIVNVVRKGCNGDSHHSEQLNVHSLGVKVIEIKNNSTLENLFQDLNSIEL
jgi:phosphomevalonate kinase